MSRIYRLLLLLAFIFANTEAMLEDDSSSSSNEESSSRVLASPLGKRKFYISMRSLSTLVDARKMSDVSVMGWFFNSGSNPTKGVRPSAKEELFLLRVAENKLNLNFANAVNYKNAVTASVPEAETAIMISKDGFHCDEDFCLMAGEEQYGMGICSPYYCDCSQDTPKPHRCDTLLDVFDPVYMTCAEAYKVKICGF